MTPICGSRAVFVVAGGPDAVARCREEPLHGGDHRMGPKLTWTDAEALPPDDLAFDYYAQSLPHGPGCRCRICRPCPRNDMADWSEIAVVEEDQDDDS